MVEDANAEQAEADRLAPVNDTHSTADTLRATLAYFVLYGLTSWLIEYVNGAMRRVSWLQRIKGSEGQ